MLVKLIVFLSLYVFLTDFGENIYLNIIYVDKKL